MKIEELKQLIEANSTDGEVNHEELNKAINTQFDGLIEAKMTKAKDSAKGENIAEFIKEQGFENIDQFTASLNNSKASATELSEKVTRLEQELGLIKPEYETLKTKSTDYSYLSKLGNVREDAREFALYKIKGLMDESTDFDAAKEKYLTDNTSYLKEPTEIVTKLPKGIDPAIKTDGVAAILEGKYGIKLE